MQFQAQFVRVLPSSVSQFTSRHRRAEEFPAPAKFTLSGTCDTHNCQTIEQHQQARFPRYLPRCSEPAMTVPSMKTGLARVPVEDEAGRPPIIDPMPFNKQTRPCLDGPHRRHYRPVLIFVASADIGRPIAISEFDSDGFFAIE